MKTTIIKHRKSPEYDYQKTYSAFAADIGKEAVWSK